MAELEITQAEAEALLNMKKRKVDDTRWEYPDIGGRIVIPLMGVIQRESFLLDVRKARIELVQGTYQCRNRVVIILARLDIGGTPHVNPDGERIQRPHLHLYRKGFADKWAFFVPNEFTNPAELWQSLQDFMVFCRVTEPPNIERGLFT